MAHYMKNNTGIELLKYHGDLLQSLPKVETSSALRSFARSKDYPFHALYELSRNGYLGNMLSLITRTETIDLEQMINLAGATAFSRKRLNRRFSTYNGASHQNEAIQRCIQESKSRASVMRSTTAEGAAVSMPRIGIRATRADIMLATTPVTIVGGGPAGLMTARALVDIGWDSNAITVIDKSGKYGGIWNYPMVANASRNNPRDLLFLNSELTRAPGGGDEVVRFIEELQHSYTPELQNPIQGIVTCIEPSNLSTTVHYRVGKEERAITSPIVINALGNGRPLPISCEGKMTTSASPGDAGYRWQQIITPEKAKALHGKRVILIGLGNSTGEMMVQFEKLNSEGFKIDYRVLTHYPWLSVNFPHDELIEDGNSYRVFRDLSRPTLVDFTGDLAEYGGAYAKALREGKIISDVVHWGRKKNKMQITQRDKKKKTELDFAELYTLIGYGHSPQEKKQLGIMCDEQNNSLCDYDGEFQRASGRKDRSRVHKGYFGIGALIASSKNPNAMVIPGMLYALPDLLFGIIMRSYEYHEGSQR